MAYGSKPFRKFQVSNPENTLGTAEAAVEILYGQITAPYNDELWYRPEDDRGLLSMNIDDQVQVGNEVELTIEGDVNQRHIIWALCNTIRGNITPTQPDAVNEPNSYLWTIEPTLTSPNTPDATNGIDTFTVEYGDNVQAYEVEYVVGTALEISGGPDATCKYSWEAFGRQVTNTTFTSLSQQTVQYFPFNLSTYFIDSSYAGIGGTQKTGLLRAFTWRLETEFQRVIAADGNYYFSYVSENRKKVTLEATYYRDDTNYVAELAKFRGPTQTPVYSRIALLGEAEMDSGQSNPPYIYLDGRYDITEWPADDDENGLSVATITMESVYDSTAAKEFGVKVLTDLAAYP